MKARSVVAAVVGVAGTVLLQSGALASGTGSVGQGRGEITLQMAGGTCSVVATDRIKAKGGVVVQWHISNGCDREYAVGITNFRKGGAPVDPLGCPAVDRGKQVKSGHQAMLTCAVRKDAGVGVYAYDIALDGKVVKDPELEIEN
jgi:hypothetical protein